MVVVLMGLRRCCANRKVRGLEDERPQVGEGGQICPVQRHVLVLGNGLVQGSWSSVPGAVQGIPEANSPLTDIVA